MGVSATDIVNLQANAALFRTLPCTITRAGVPQTGTPLCRVMPSARFYQPVPGSELLRVPIWEVYLPPGTDVRPADTLAVQWPGTLVLMSENFDEHAAPALPGGWTIGAPLQTSSAYPSTSAPNSLVYRAADVNGSVVPLAGWNNADTASGNVALSCTLRFCTDGSAGHTLQQLALYARANHAMVGNNWQSVTAYAAVVSINDPSGVGLRLSRAVAGTLTTLGTIPAPVVVPDVSYRLFLECSGSTIAARLLRLTDGYWLNGHGAFVSDPAQQTVALSAQDSTISGAGYVALLFYDDWSPQTTISTDDILLEALPRAPLQVYGAGSILDPRSFEVERLARCYLVSDSAHPAGGAYLTDNAVVNVQRGTANPHYVNRGVYLEYPTRQERVMAGGADVPVLLADLPDSDYQNGDVITLLSVAGHTVVPHPQQLRAGLVERLSGPPPVTSVQLTGVGGY